MLKVVGVVGYKNSGKTTLTYALARELKRRGHAVTVVKHASHPLDLSGKDTAVFGAVVEQVGFISPQESAVFWKGQLSLEDMIGRMLSVRPHLNGDIILVEGFKADRTFPKIVCLRGEPDDRDLFDGLTLCAVGSADEMPEDVDVPVFARDELDLDPGAADVDVDRGRSGGRSESTSAVSIGGVADLVEERAFKLPNLDCEECGRQSCYDMARDIVAGTGSIEECVSLQPTTEIRVDGQLMPLNPFISEIVRSTILGMLSSLKGFKKGRIEITI